MARFSRQLRKTYISLAVLAGLLVIVLFFASTINKDNAATVDAITSIPMEQIPAKRSKNEVAKSLSQAKMKRTVDYQRKPMNLSSIVVNDTVTSVVRCSTTRGGEFGHTYSDLWMTDKFIF